MKPITEDGMITLDSTIASDFGFTSDKFDGYLWKKDNSIWISLIISLNPGKGNLKQLFNKIEGYGYSLIIPTPSARMRMICEKRGMSSGTIKSDGETLECMRKELVIKTIKA